MYYVPINSVLFANNKAEGNSHLEEIGVDVNIVFTLIVTKGIGERGLESTGSR